MKLKLIHNPASTHDVLAEIFMEGDDLKDIPVTSSNSHVLPGYNKQAIIREVQKNVKTCKVGDRVIMFSWCFHRAITIEGKTFAVVHEDNILGLVEDNQPMSKVSLLRGVDETSAK